MDWFNVIGAGVSGGLAALVARLVFGKPKHKGFAFAAVLLVSFFVIFVLFQTFALPYMHAAYTSYRVESVLLRTPSFQAIKEYEPEIYETMLAKIRADVPSEATDTEIITIAWNYNIPFVVGRIKYASDEAALSYMEASVSGLNEVKALGGDTCYSFLYPQVSRPPDSRLYLSKETMDAKDRAVVEIIRTSSQGPQDVPLRANMQPILDSLHIMLETEFGEDIWMLWDSVHPEVDRQMVCLMMISMQEKILSLPEAVRGKMVRYWWSGE